MIRFATEENMRRLVNPVKIPSQNRKIPLIVMRSKIFTTEWQAEVLDLMSRMGFL